LVGVVSLTGDTVAGISAAGGSGAGSFGRLRFGLTASVASGGGLLPPLDLGLAMISSLDDCSMSKNFHFNWPKQKSRPFSRVKNCLPANVFSTSASADNP
jgi:hypothetical protein